MRKSKMSIIILGCIFIFLIAFLVLLPATQAKAETVKYNYTTQHTKGEFVVLPDMKGHIAGIYEGRGVAIFKNEVAAIKILGTFEKKKGKVSFQGYNQITFKDGSAFMDNVYNPSVKKDDETPDEDKKSENFTPNLHQNEKRKLR